MFNLYKRTVILVLCYVFISVTFELVTDLNSDANSHQTNLNEISRNLISKEQTIPAHVHAVPKQKTEKEKEDMMCHYMKENDVLQRVSELSIFPSNSIFFVDSSCEEITSRKACSIESAAKANPGRQINVLFTFPISLDNSILKTLLMLNNTRIFRIHLENFADLTPLDEKFKKRPIVPEDLNMNLDDILKYITLFKYSGILLSTDVIVARSFDKLSNNWIVKESPYGLSSHMFGFSDNFNGRIMAHIALNVIVNDLAVVEGGYKYRFDNNFIITQFLYTWCGVKKIVFLNTSTCKDLEIGSPANFNPIPLHKKQKYFQPGSVDQWKNDMIYTYQTWQSFTKKNTVNNNSLYVSLAKTYCPMTYEFYGNKFGNE